MMTSPEPTSISGFARRVSAILPAGDDQPEHGDGGGQRQHPLLELAHGGLAGQVRGRDLHPPGGRSGSRSR